MANDIYADGELTTGNNDGTSWADAYRGAAGLQTAFDSASAGDTVHVTRTFTLSAPVSVDMASGSPADGSPIRVVGYNYNAGSPVNDGTKAVLDANGATGHCLVVDDEDGWMLENVEFRSATDTNVWISATDHASEWIFLRCDSHDAGKHGWGSDAKYWRRSKFILCRAQDNGEAGFHSAYDRSVFLGCIGRGNGTNGVQLYGGVELLGCLVEGNGAYGIALNDGNAFLSACVVDGNAYHGIYSSAGPVVVWGCRVTNNGTNSGHYGLKADSSMVLDLYNFFAGNVGGAVDGSLIVSAERGGETRLTTGQTGYGDRDAGRFGLRLGAAGWRTEVPLGDGLNFLRFARGLPTSVIPDLARMGGRP